MARRRRRRVPEVLRRAYHGRARTLEETILSLLPRPPPSPSDCRCGGRICLGCAGSTHLLREDDSTEYRLLLTRAFCVLSSDAPPPPVDHLCSGSSQRSIVRNAMEILKGNSEGCSNTLFNGYDQQSRFSLSGESLSTYAWDLLVTRIGDPLMVFLLEFSSIFVPSTNKNWRQLTGIPLDSLIKSYKNCHQLKGTPLNSLIKSSKILYSISESRNLQSFLVDEVDLGDKIKMRYKYGDEPKMHAPFKIHESSTLTGAGGSLKLKDHNVLTANPRKRARKYQRNLAETNNMHFVLHDSSNEGIDTRDNSDGKHSNISEANLSLRPKESRKRARLYSWQRRKKRKLNSADVIHKGTPVKDDKDFSIVKFQQNPDIKFHCQHLVSAKPDNFDAITEKHPLKDRSSFNVIGSITQEELGFIRKKRAHSLLGEEMHCDQVDMSFVDNNCVCPQPMADKEPMESYVDMGCLGVPPMPMKKTLPPVVIQTCRAIPNLQNKSPQTELPSMKQNELHSLSEKMASRCFHCLMLQAPERVADGDLIKRRFIFYDTFLSASVLPRSHILNRLRPNDSGALSLMKHIFGISEGQLAICSPSCRRFNGHSANNSKCLFHSLLGLLKSLIRNTQRCWNRKLLCKHCLVSPSKMFNNCFNESTSKLVIEGPSSPKLFKKRDIGSQHSSSNMLVEGSHISGSGNKKIEQLYHKASKLCSPQLKPVESYCRYKQVVSFIWAVTRRIVPLDLLGDKSTWRALQKNISKFVRLRRFEVFCLKQCIHGLKTSCYPFLSKIRQSDCSCRKKDIKDAGNDKSTRKEPGSSDDVKKTLHTKIFRCWIYWYFNYIVVPMVTANFYVTETESGRQDVFYYPKPVWRNLVDRTITSLSKQNYRLINNAYLRHILKGRQFGFSKVRFLPKEKNLRPIANLKALSMLRQPRKKSAARQYLTTRPTNATDHEKLSSTNKKRRLVYGSVNSSLQDLHAILRKLKIDYPQKLGSSVFDYNDIYKKLLHFVSKARTASKTVPCVYLVVADVSKAFDSINQDILLNIMKNNIDKDEYFMRKYAQIVCTKKSTRTIYAREPYDSGCINNATSTFGTSIRGILIDKGTTKIKQEKLIYLLKEHLKHNIVKLGQNFYLQKIGIPQGSLLSSLLCSFYYGHLESCQILPCLEKTLEHPNPNCWINTDTSDLDEEQLRLFLGEQSSVCNHTSIDSMGVGKSQCPFPEYMLLRLIDDFLFISTSKKQATCFVNRLKRGFKNYNCYMNDNKFGLNFDMEEYSVPVNRKYTGADGLSFLPWSGLLLNCRTLEVQADYTRYCGIHMSSTITVHVHTKPAQQLKEKLCDYMRPKCHPIFYDSRINSPPVVSLNAYQAFLLCAMKFHCYTCSMPDITNRNPSYLQEIIERSIRYMYKLIKKRMHELKHNSNGIKPSLVLKKADIVWLGLSAYVWILGKKQSRHKDLLWLLKCKLAAHGKVCNISSHLEYAVDDSHSSMFWEIRF